jgi:hypothetical protein
MTRNIANGLLRFRLVVAVAFITLVGGNAPPGAGATDNAPVAVTHKHFNSVEGALTQSGGGTIGESQYKNPPSPICSTSWSAAANVNTDCENTIAPHNETTIAVNPTNPLNQIAGANDYQTIPVGSSGAIQWYETMFSRAHVTFDGGRTWTTYPIDFKTYTATGDPAIAFDTAGNAYYSTLGFVWGQYSPGTTAPDVLVAQSRDGGKTWSEPARVAAGTGSSAGVSSKYNDKEYVAAWGDGNAIVTWTRFNDGIKGSYISSPIYDSVTHDGGATWTAPTQISGSGAFCIGAQGGNACDQDQGSVPVVAADGSIFVSYISAANLTTGRNQYLVVKVDPATGALIGGPSKVADLVDGFTDLPVNILGFQTYQGSQFRTWACGNISADSTSAGHLAVVWSDMRNSTLPAPASPYEAVTNSDVVISQSFDGGLTWSPPVAIAATGDQFMPWGVYDTSGKLRIGYFDRSYDPANHQYGYTLATEQKAGSLKFSFAQLTTVLSDPTLGDRWFSGSAPNHATAFLGDYSGIAALPTGGIVALWTDMRNNICFTTRCGAGEDVFYATAP